MSGEETMTEAKWMFSTNATLLLDHLSEIRHLDDRKLRLFAVACCRGVWFWLEQEQNEQALQAHERIADDLPVEVHREPPVWNAWPEVRVTPDWTGWSFAGYAAMKSVREAGETKGATDALLLHDIFGNPFRPVLLDPSWQTPTILALATAAYDTRILPTGELDLSRLAVLADALEDAGCTDAAILEHLRGPGPHVRGCWAVDLLLGKTCCSFPLDQNPENAPIPRFPHRSLSA